MKLFELFSIVDVRTLPNVSPDANSVDNIMKIVFAVSGSLAVLVVTIAGFRYVMSMGENIEATKKAKDGILNAIIGLVIVIFANVIIGFIINRL